MIKKIGWIGWFFCIFLFGGCEKESVDYGLGDFRVDLVTCQMVDGVPSFVLDNGIRLIPEQTLSELSQHVGSRFLVNYVFCGDDVGQEREATVHSFSRILTDTVRYCTSEELKRMADDPIGLISLWCSGGYMNVRFKIEVNQQIHALQMFAREPEEGGNTDTLQLELRHNGYFDVPGYYSAGYGSFYIGHLLSENIRMVRLRLSSFNYGTKDIVFNLNQNQ